MNAVSTQPTAFGAEELRSLTDAELDEVGGGCAGLIILAGCAVVAAYCTYKMAKAM